MTDRPDARIERVTMTVNEAAALLGLSISATYEAASRGQIPAIKVGRRVLVKRHLLLVMLELENQVSPTAQNGIRQ